jgi:hypothetical protein
VRCSAVRCGAVLPPDQMTAGALPCGTQEAEALGGVTPERGLSYLVISNSGLLECSGARQPQSCAGSSLDSMPAGAHTAAPPLRRQRSGQGDQHGPQSAARASDRRPCAGPARGVTYPSPAGATRTAPVACSTASGARRDIRNRACRPIDELELPASEATLAFCWHTCFRLQKLRHCSPEGHANQLTRHSSIHHLPLKRVSDGDVRAPTPWPRFAFSSLCFVSQPLHPRD